MNDQYTIVIAGDVLPSSNNYELFEKGDVTSLFDDRVRELIWSANFSIVNLEGPLTDAVKKQDKVGPVLKAPKKTVNGLKLLGVKCVALANNHFTDYLQQGCQDTISALEEAGICYFGGGLNSDSIKTNISIQIGSKKVCIYNVSESFFNIPTKNQAGVNIYDEYQVCNEIKVLKKTHDYLIVIYHGGAEMCPYPTPNVRKRFRRMADCGADFITAQHTHCIGCEEHYQDSYMLYGQGNFFMEHMKNPIARKGLVTEISFSEELIRIKHHIVNIFWGKIVYDPKQDFVDFNKRSEEIVDERLSEKRYEEFIRNNEDLKNKYYRAYRGNFVGMKLFNRLFPKAMLQHIEKKYDKEKLSRIVFSLESDRMREEVLCLWKQVKERKS